MAKEQPTVVYSPDGTHWWDGQTWLPVAPPTVPAPKANRTGLTVTLLVVALALFGTIAGVIGASGGGSSSITDEQVHDAYCESFGNRSEAPDCP